jgi:hypothetical protein
MLASPAVTRPAMPFSITSRLGAEHRTALENLLFFNSQQEGLRERIEAVIDRYGVPEIALKDGSLRISLRDAPDAQALYAVLPQGRPIACALFLRSEADRFLVLHLGVEPAWSGRGEHAADHVVMHLLRAIREAARRVRGVSLIEVLYGAGGVGRMKV